MSFGDSAAVFKARAADIGLTDDEFKKLESQGLTTMASFAFCCHFNPSASDEKPLVDLVTKVLATSPTLKQMSCFRRLFAEAYATIASHIEDSSVKRLAPADRAERLKEQQSQLKGIDLSGHHEPGDGLVDRAVSMYESDRLQYIEWASCISRQHELLTGQKKDSSVSPLRTRACVFLPSCWQWDAWLALRKATGFAWTTASASVSFPLRISVAPKASTCVPSSHAIRFILLVNARKGRRSDRGSSSRPPVRIGEAQSAGNSPSSVAEPPDNPMTEPPSKVAKTSDSHALANALASQFCSEASFNDMLIVHLKFSLPAPMISRFAGKPIRPPPE